MLKSKIISLKYRTGLKRNLSSKGYNFKNTNQVGIIYNTNILLSYQVKELVRSLRQDGKRVSSIGFHTTEKGKLPPSSVDLTQFDFFGRLKPHEELDQFLAQKFDLCICLDEANHFAINYLLVKTKANFKVGITENEDANKKFDLIVKCSSAKNKPSELIKYLKIIESND